MRKLFSIVFSAVLLLIFSGQGTWAQNGGLPGRQGPFAPGTITHSDRTVLHDDIVHYRYDVVVGRGKFDVIRLHRVVKERVPRHPVRTVDGVLLLPGAPNSFEMIFMEPLISSVPAWDHSIAVFLAKNDIDVWGMDYAWALVPAETTDFKFMKGWGLEKDVQDAEIALSVARQIRGITDQSFGPLHLLGFSWGTTVAYVVAGEEAKRPHFLRNIKGLIPVDYDLKLDRSDPVSNSYRLSACDAAAADKAMLDAGVYDDSFGVVVKLFGDLGRSAPGDPSPLIPGFTNYQAALFAGASGGPPIFWHFVGGSFDESGIPTGLRYTDPWLWVDAIRAVPSYVPVRAEFDVDTSRCDEVNVAIDDHIGEIAVPILYVGAGGGEGRYGYYMTSLTASKDVTKFTVQLLGDDDRLYDFGHADLFMATNAETLAWRPILDWLKTHR